VTAPVWPNVPAEKGHYESFYLRAADPAGPRAVWIRYTVHKRPGAQPLGSLWFTYFEEGVHTTKHTWPDPRPGEWIDIDRSHFGPDRAQGEVEGVGWDLTVEPLAEPLRHLPRPWMYTAPLPKTKPESPLPHARFNGRLRFGTREIEVDDWRGMSGHNWGTEHAETWIWVQGAGFAEDESAWLDLTVARLKIGPFTTPWVANGALEVGGARTRLGGVGRRARVQADARRARIDLPGQAKLNVRARDIVVWRYAAPNLEERHSAHSSNAEAVLEAGGRTLTSRHGSAYELGVRPGGHGELPVQPYPDGV
jgi:hypothetical protein